MGLHKHNFSLAMHGYRVFPNSMQKKEIFVKLIYSIKTNITSFLSKSLVRFLSIA